MPRIRNLILLALWAAALASCMEAQQRTHERADAPVLGSHNAAGGYIPACEDLPGLIGDDC